MSDLISCPTATCSLNVVDAYALETYIILVLDLVVVGVLKNIGLVLEVLLRFKTLNPKP